MRHFVVAAILLSMPYAAQAESLPVRLRDGATWTITATHVREATGPRAQNWALTTVKSLTWVAPHGKSRARLTIRPISATAGADSPSEITRARSLAVPATLEVDEALTPGVIVNLDAVRAAFQDVLGRDVRGSEALADAAAKAMIATEVGWAARGQGAELDLGKLLESDSEVENPLGGAPIKVRDSYRLETYDTKDGRAVIVWHQTTDPSALGRGLVTRLAASMRAANPNMKPEDIEVAMKDVSGSLESTCRHEIDIPTGLAVKIDCRTSNSMTIRGETRGSTDTWTITQTLPETP